MNTLELACRLLDIKLFCRKTKFYKADYAKALILWVSDLVLEFFMQLILNPEKNTGREQTNPRLSERLHPDTRRS
jgi:hypothetical protein